MRLMGLGYAAALFQPWAWRMAWRDSRRSRRRLLLFGSSTVLGIAALVAISSFSDNVEAAIGQHARSLLGADLAIESRQPFDPEAEDLFRVIGGVQSRQISFSSMLYLPRQQATRLVQVRALSGEFPYYGTFESEPRSAVAAFRRGVGVLAEKSLLLQLGAQPGDPLRLGQWSGTIAGSLESIPGETIGFATIAPRVFLPMAELAGTDLLRPGSLARHKVYFKFPPGTNVRARIEPHRSKLAALRLRVETVASRQERVGRSVEHLGNYLSLVGVVALLLGGIGVGAGIQLHIRDKLGTIALLRCLGATVAQSFAVYLAQALTLALLGTLAGAALGLAVQTVLPRVIADFLPLEVAIRPAWGAAGTAMGIGFSAAVLFALFPLVKVRRASPLHAIRSACDLAGHGRPDLAQLAVGGLLGAGMLAFCLAYSRRWEQGLGFALGLGAAFLALWLMGGLVRGLARRLVRAGWPFAWRQGFANLYRPQNRSVLLMVSLGLAAFLLLTLQLSQRNLIAEIGRTSGSHRANAVLFDVQTDQRAEISRLIQAQGLPVLDEVPMVSMRLESVKGRSVKSLLADRSNRRHNWVFRREYRSTYRDALRDSETLIAGTWHPRATPADEFVPVSLERELAEDLRVGLGDELVFDVQGMSIATRVASLREVNWRRMQPNFFVVFPAGVLEEAPATHVFLTRVESAAQSAALQRDVVRQFPNVSAIDLTLILETIESLLDRVRFVLGFMALFTVLTGALVLVASLLAGRYQRIHESILLRTLGASRAQIRQILCAEYVCLGSLAAALGILLSVPASWALAAFVFEIPFRPAPGPLAVAWVALTILTVVTGLAANWGIGRHPPLAMLRQEG